MMLSTKKIIEKIWDAQGYGNLAVWDDGTAKIVEPGQVPPPINGLPPRAVFKPIPLVGGFPMLDHALYNKTLQEKIEETIKNSGGEISRD